jgi:rRNA-processing protein FCF1
VLFLVIRTGFPLEQELGRLAPGARLLLPGSVVGELDGLAKSLTPGAAAARALADRFSLVPTRAGGDEGIIEAALRTRAWVATADRELQRRLASQGITVVIPRDRHRLEVVPGRPPSPAGQSRKRRGVPNGGNG